jgi:hypothetical protein
VEFGEFAERVRLTSEDELGRARLIAYFIVKSQGQKDFSVEDLLAHWRTLAVGQPNKSRLSSRMTQSGMFPRASKPNRFRLHADVVVELDQSHSQLWASQRLPRSGARTFVDVARIDELRMLVGGKPDPLRLVRLCEETNINFAAGCTMGAALLARTIINHVPPALGFKTFAEVANNYGGDPKTQRSFKKIAQRLEETQRAIADSIAHETMREAESLPTFTQIDFSQELDLLLAEVARVLRARNAKGAA